MGTYCKNHPFTHHPKGFQKQKQTKQGTVWSGSVQAGHQSARSGEEAWLQLLQRLGTSTRFLTQRQRASPRRHPLPSILHQSSSSAETDHQPHTGQHNRWQALPSGSLWSLAMKHCLFACASLQWWDLPSSMPWALPFVFLCPWPNYWALRFKETSTSACVTIRKCSPDSFVSP